LLVGFRTLISCSANIISSFFVSLIKRLYLAFYVPRVVVRKPVGTGGAKYMAVNRKYKSAGREAEMYDMKAGESGCPLV